MTVTSEAIGCEMVKPPNTSKNRYSVAIVIVVLFLSLIILIPACDVISNINARNNPPAACLWFGGRWSLFGGWTCQ